MEAGEKKVKLVAAKAGAAAVKATKKVAGAVKRAVKNRKK